MDKLEENGMAMFRFGLIAPVINQTFNETSKTAYYRAVCKCALKLPDGREVMYSSCTLRYWEGLYRKGGFAALKHKARSDKGYSRKITDKTARAIFAINKEFPKMNATMIYEKLVADGVIHTTEISLCTIQRFVRSRIGNTKPLASLKDRKAFEAERVGVLWQADTLYGPYVGSGKNRCRSYMVAILDDKSRLLVGARFFASDNSLNFQTVLKDAIVRFGVPEKLYVDNGAPYKNDQLSAICGALGIVLIHAPVRDGAAKGKIERFNKTCRTRFLSVLKDRDTLDMDTLNDAFITWINTYNTTEHSAIGQAPMDAWRQGRDTVRCPTSEQWLYECFLNRMTRTVRNDATISISKVSYDVPMAFIGQKVEIHFSPDDMADAHILSEGERYPIYPTDKVVNSKARRDNFHLRLDYGRKGEDADVLPTIPA
jgi:transposase InsO family protein